MVKLRMKRFGRRNRAFFRITATDSRRPRDGRPIEELGFYDPLEKDQAKALKLDTDRVRYWLSQGAQPSQTVRDMLRKAGFTLPPSRHPRSSKPKTKAAPAAAAAETPKA